MFNIYTCHPGWTITLPFPIASQSRDGVESQLEKIQNDRAKSLFQKTEGWKGKMMTVAGGCWIIKDKNRRWHRPASSHQITQVHQEAYIWIMHARTHTHTHHTNEFPHYNHIPRDLLMTLCINYTNIVNFMYSFTSTHVPAHSTYTCVHTRTKAPQKYGFTQEPAWR